MLHRHIGNLPWKVYTTIVKLVCMITNQQRVKNKKILDWVRDQEARNLVICLDMNHLSVLKSKVTLTSQLMMRREMVRSLLWKNHPACKDKQNFHVSFAGLISLPQGASYHVDIGSVIHAFKDGRIACLLGERPRHALFAKPVSPGSARWTRLVHQIRRYTRRPFLVEL